jgi:hypothetical protein
MSYVNTHPPIGPNQRPHQGHMLYREEDMSMQPLTDPSTWCSMSMRLSAVLAPVRQSCWWRAPRGTRPRAAATVVGSWRGNAPKWVRQGHRSAWKQLGQEPEGGGVPWQEGAATGWCGGAGRQHRVEMWRRRFVPMGCVGFGEEGDQD